MLVTQQKKFDSKDEPLTDLLGKAANGKLQLPDFQRRWVWDDDHIRSLLASISLAYPIGAVMTLRTGNPDVRFRPRTLEGVSLADSIEPDLMLLDGQQRMTSLYMALSSREPVLTRDARGRTLKRHYYADINASIDPNADREEDGIVSIPDDRMLRHDFGRRVYRDLTTRENEIAEEMFPLDIVLDYSKTMAWQLQYLSSGPGEQPERVDKWGKFHTEIIQHFIQYDVPTIELTELTPKEAVCQVFEKVNTGGVTLTVFELLTATYAVDDFKLREDWEQRQSELHQHELLSVVKATHLLQVIALLASYDRRHAYLSEHTGDERAPAVSCKRRDILRLKLEDYLKWADTATQGFKRAVPFLHSEYIFRNKDLPYVTQVVPLAAIFGILGDRADSYNAQQRLQRWYWCGVFGEMYGGSTETRFALDLVDCIQWIESPEDIPRTVQDAQFQAERLLTLRTRNSAAYKGLYALQMKHGSMDLQTGRRIDVNAIFEHAIDIHHIFPKRWCDDNDIASVLANCVVNKTAIDARTNRRIGSNAPSIYLRNIEERDGIDERILDKFIHSHYIDSVALRQDDFQKFFNHRFETLVDQVARVMGKQVNRTANRDESPFSEAGNEKTLLRRVQKLLTTDENRVLELKSTGCKNLHTGKKDPNVELAIVKSIAGFMNANGGTLLVGVDDQGLPVGIAQEFSELKNPNTDGWQLWLTDLVSTHLGTGAATGLDTKFCTIDGFIVACIDVGASDIPVFSKVKKGGERNVFFVRVNNSTRKLSGQELLDYRQRQWSA